MSNDEYDDQPPPPEKPHYKGMDYTTMRGLRCRTCGCQDLRVYYTRNKPPVIDKETGVVIRSGSISRRRRCRNCGRLSLTRECDI